MMDFIHTLRTGIRLTLRWLLLQGTAIAVIIGLRAPILVAISLASGVTFRETLMDHGIHTLYTFWSGFVLFIPVCTPLFCLWQAFRKGRAWTFVLPLAVLWIIVYLSIAHGLDWNFRIISVDQYMLGGLLSPSLGAAMQAVHLVVWGRKIHNSE